MAPGRRARDRQGRRDDGLPLRVLDDAQAPEGRQVLAVERTDRRAALRLGLQVHLRG